MRKASSSRPAPADDPEEEARQLADRGFNLARDAVRSGSTPEYNCLAWTVDDFESMWSPVPLIPVGGGRFEELGGYFWPCDVPPTMGIDTVAQMYANRGFRECDDPAPDPGFDRVAIYGFDKIVCEHAAVQRDGEEWSSKMGAGADVVHPDPYAIEGGLGVGTVQVLMRRAVKDRPASARCVPAPSKPPTIDVPQRSTRE